MTHVYENNPLTCIRRCACALNKQQCNKVRYISSPCTEVNQFGICVIYDLKIYYYLRQQTVLSTAVLTWDVNLHRVRKQTGRG